MFTVIFFVIVLPIIVANADLHCYDCSQDCYNVTSNEIIFGEAANLACISYFLNSKDPTKTGVYRGIHTSCAFVEEHRDVQNCKECKSHLCNNLEYNRDGTIKKSTTTPATASYVASAELRCYKCSKDCNKVNEDDPKVLCDVALKTECYSYYFKSNDSNKSGVRRECSRGDIQEVCAYLKETRKEHGDVMNCWSCTEELCNNMEYNSNGTIESTTPTPTITPKVATYLSIQSQLPDINNNMNGKGDNSSRGSKPITFPLLFMIIYTFIILLQICY